jgi:hypothetical protein
LSRNHIYSPHPSPLFWNLYFTPISRHRARSKIQLRNLLFSHTGVLDTWAKKNIHDQKHAKIFCSLQIRIRGTQKNPRILPAGRNTGPVPSKFLIFSDITVQYLEQGLAIGWVSSSWVSNHRPSDGGVSSGLYQAFFVGPFCVLRPKSRPSCHLLPAGYWIPQHQKC